MADSADIAAIQPPHRYSVLGTPKPNRPGTWNSMCVSILDGDARIGGYIRNYPSAVASTFFPFLSGGKWLALYSRDYTATRVMSLPDCKDLGGERRDAFGFCPIEFWVPTYRIGSYDWVLNAAGQKGGEPSVRRMEHVFWPGDEAAMAQIAAAEAAEAAGRGHSPGRSNHRLGPWESAPFGFVAGCIWGDDCSWKIQFIDLSRAAEGKIVRQEKFGYIELPRRMSLSEAIDMSGWKPGGEFIGITHTVTYSLKTGKADE